MTTFRCEANHKLNADIRAAARIQIKKHTEIPEELERFAQRKVAHFDLELANRCNDPSEAEAAKLCLGSETLWIDFGMTEPAQVPEDEDSVERFMCRAGCKLGNALTAQKSLAISVVNSKMQGLEVDDSVVSEISCVPSLHMVTSANLVIKEDPCS